MIVADFENHSRDSMLADVVTTALRLELSQSPLVRVMSPPAAQAARRRMSDPDPTAPLSDTVAQLLAAREGLALVVRGDVSSVGPDWVISAQLVMPADRPPAGDGAGDRRRLDSTCSSDRRVARGLRERIGESSRASVRRRP